MSQSTKDFAKRLENEFPWLAVEPDSDEWVDVEPTSGADVIDQLQTFYYYLLSERQYDKRHGGPFDRGAADSWYRRGRNPHYYKGATYCTELVLESDMTSEEIEAYNAGFDQNEQEGLYKDWE